MPTEHEKYGVGESPRGQLLSRSGRSGCAFRVPAPARRARGSRLEMPRRGGARRGRASESPRRAAGCAPGSALGARAPGVWSGDGACVCVCQVGSGAGDGVPVLPSPSSPATAVGLQRFPRAERETTAPAQGAHPRNASEAQSLAGVRAAAGAGPEPPAPSRPGARGGGAGTWQRLRSSALCSLEGNGCFGPVFVLFLCFYFGPASGRGERGGGGDGRQLWSGHGEGGVGKPEPRRRGRRFWERTALARALREGAGQRSAFGGKVDNKGRSC